MSRCKRVNERVGGAIRDRGERVFEGGCMRVCEGGSV